MSALVVKDLVVHRGGLPVVRGASLVVDPGSITVLLGANGAGKTTLLEGISGAIKIAGGSAELLGTPIAALRPNRRARLGLAHIEQGRAVYRDLTTQENIEVARHPDASADEVFALFPELQPRRHVRAGLLSGGEQQMLLIGRALASRPRVLLIDEMSLGLAPLIVRRLMTIVRDLAKSGLSVLLVEQFATLALAIGQRAYVLRRGEIAYDGSCAALRADPKRLHSLYLGQ